MYRNTPNEIVYTESGVVELKAEIRKRQYKFWENILKNIEKAAIDKNMKTSFTSAIKNMLIYLILESKLLYTIKTQTVISLLSKTM